MLKVQVLYKLSMYETDWTMTEEEYSEFIASTQGLPRPMTQKSEPVALEDIPWHGAKTPSLVKDQEIARLHKLLQEKDTKIDEMNIFYEGRDTKRIWELEKELEAMTLKAKGMVEKPYWKDFPNTAVVMDEPGTKVIVPDLKEFLDQPAWQPKDPEDQVEEDDLEPWDDLTPAIKYVEPPKVPEAPKIVPIVPEKVPETPKTVQEKPKKAKIEPDDRFKAPNGFSAAKKNSGRQGRDYEKHIKMMDDNFPVKTVVEVLMEDFKLTKAAAQSTYNNVKRTHERRKVNQNLAESREKVNVIPSNPVTIVKPSNSKIPRNLREEIACMPEYDNPINFKDAIITREYCNLYDIATLKAYYKETHENIKW